LTRKLQRLDLSAGNFESDSNIQPNRKDENLIRADYDRDNFDAVVDHTLATFAAVEGGFIDAHWMKDGNTFWWIEGRPSNMQIYKFDPIAQKKTPLLDTARFRSALTALTGRRDLSEADLLFDQFTFLPDENSVSFWLDSKSYAIRLDSYTVSAAPPSASVDRDRRSPRLLREGRLAFMPPIYEISSPDGCWFLGSKDGNLYIRSTLDGHTEAVTRDGDEAFGWDVERCLWASNSRLVAAVKTDERAVPLYPVVRWLKPTPDVEWARRDLTGSSETSHEYYVFDVNTKKKIRINSDDGLIQYRAWRWDASELIVSRQGLQRLELLAVNPASGNIRILFEERTHTFFDFMVSLPNSQHFVSFADNQHFLWISERDGWNQIYLYDFNGALIRKVTNDRQPVARIVAVDEKEGWIYYTAYSAGDRPYDLHFYRVTVKGGKPFRLSVDPGQHDRSLYLSYVGGTRGEGIELSPSLQFFLDSHSDVDRPPQTEMRRTDGTLIAVLAEANVASIDRFRPPPEEFSVTAADGHTDLYGLIYKPYNFDDAKKYPIVDSLYAGPQTTWVSRTFASGLSAQAQAIANLGFIVISLDARGTPNRGKAFQDVVYQNFGRYEIADHVSALSQLAARKPYADLNRIGAYGSSFGGYFVIRALLQAPEVFRVGIAISPITDLRQVTGLPAILLGPAGGNRESYELTSNLTMAYRLRGHLLLIHGTSDINAPFSATIQMIQALERAGKPYDLVLLPDQSHALTADAALYSLKALGRYLVRNL
jgi:dipeptidyl aminopeptidase/acylaminoacyl peptidase